MQQYEESINEYHFDQFAESNSMPGMMDDLEIFQEQAPDSLKKETRQLTTAGVIAALSGIGIFLGMNLSKLGIDLAGLAENLMPWLVMGGIGALGFGMIKVMRKVLGKKMLNLPKLKIRRKFFPSRQQAQPQNQWRNYQQFVAPKQYRMGRRLRKSLNRVFMGVAGGLAEHSGIPVTLVRLFFIAAFAISGGFAAAIYIILGLFLPAAEPKPQPNQQR